MREMKTTRKRLVQHTYIPRNDLNVGAADIWAVKVMTAREVLVYVWA